MDAVEDLCKEHPYVDLNWCMFNFQDETAHTGVRHRETGREHEIVVPAPDMDENPEGVADRLIQAVKAFLRSTAAVPLP